MPAASDSFVLPDAPASEHDDVASLPSTSSGTPSSLDTDADRDAQAEWERSLQQLQSLLALFLLPYLGKYMGRMFAYWSWARYMEWLHDVEIRWTNKRAFIAAGVVGAATL